MQYSSENTCTYPSLDCCSLYTQVPMTRELEAIYNTSNKKIIMLKNKRTYRDGIPKNQPNNSRYTPSCFLDYCWRACLNALPAIGDEDEEEDTEAYEVQPLYRERALVLHIKTLYPFLALYRGGGFFSPRNSL